MKFKPIILPLDPHGMLYAIRDEKGANIGTGTREVCEVLLHIMNKQTMGLAPLDKKQTKPPHFNLRAAIVI